MGMIFDTAVIGGGAAGLAAGVFLGRAGMNTVLLEKASRTGRKLLSTGNGTCNLSHRDAAPCEYNSAFVAPALAAFSSEETCAFFHTLGVECITRSDGRRYPRSAQSGAVLDCMRLQLAADGVQERCNAAVQEIRPSKEGFTLRLAEETVQARKVLVCAGGAASPALGGTQEGYALLTALGHTRTPLFPAIVQIKTDTAFVKALKGIRLDGTVSFWLDGRQAARQTGEILFTEYGLSGPAVLQISRHVGDWERQKRGEMIAQLDLLPDIPLPDLTALLLRRRALSRTLEDWLTGLLNKRLGQTMLRVTGLALSERSDRLSETQVTALAVCLKQWRITVTGTGGLANAQVTAGGIATDEFDPQTLQSRLVNGLYAAGEVLDVDGVCGGFNLQWAWASAYMAAQAMIRGKE